MFLSSLLVVLLFQIMSVQIINPGLPVAYMKGPGRKAAETGTMTQGRVFSADKKAEGLCF